MTDLFDQPYEEEPEAASEPSFPGRRRVLTVTELTVRIRDRLEDQFAEIWVEGELSNCRLWKTGHLYFTLKDGAAQLKGVIFRSALRYLKFKPADGLRVVARGRISVYEPKGEYQIVCEHLEPQGLGALQLAFDQLKRRLQAEGLFDKARKRPLPALPRKIGIVTSLDGAALHDIIRVLGRRHARTHLVVRPTRVQGEGAAFEIARAIHAVTRVVGVEVVIVGRGGGSIEDLWAFNEESVARAIEASPVPVISAVGHEVDVTIADFVADVRAATPSAAAEIVVARADDLWARVDRLRERLRATARGRVLALARRVHVAASRPAFAAFPARLGMRARLGAELAHALRTAALSRVAAQERRVLQLDRRLERFEPSRRLADGRARLAAAELRLAGDIRAARHRAERRFVESAARLDTLSPIAVLGRGYAVCWNGERTRVVRRASETVAGDRVRVTLAEGELECDVRSNGQ